MADVQGVSNKNPAKDERDFVTVLRSLSVPLQKSFRTQGGELVAKKTPFPLDYEASRSVLTDFEGLCDELKRLENDSHRCIISGELADGVDGSCIRRTRADFGPCEHYWIMIDADDIPMPEGLSPSDSNAEKLVAEVVNHLPEAFKTVDCWYQFSGSMGIKEGIRVHLWFWLSRKLGDQEKHAWLSSCPVDPRIYNSNHIHYTAGPSFEISSSDPFPRRSGRYQAGHGVSVVTVPENLPKVAGEFRRQRVGGLKARAGSETVFDPETGLAIDGREQLLFELSISAMFDLCVGDKVPTVDEITDRLWSLFQEKADLTYVNDRVWTRADAEEKAKARYEQKITGEFDFQARNRNIVLVPSSPSPYVTEIVSAEEGTAKLGSALDQFFTDLSEGRTPRDLIRITMGSGKTKGTIRKLKEFLATRSC